MIFIIAFLLWFFVGVLSFIYWWTSDFDLSTDEIPLLITAGFFGGFSFFIGWIVHGRVPVTKKKILLRKRSHYEQTKR
ncbi:MAG: hypothetical protein ACOCZ5_01360 [bacterium]